MKLRITILVACGLLALTQIGVAAAGPLEEARTAEQRGDYATEMALLRPLADQGNAVAQIDIGLMYEHGLGVPQDFAQAVIWYRKAADRGMPPGRQTSGGCTCMAGACRRTSCRPSSGSARPPTRATLARRPTSG